MRLIAALALAVVLLGACGDGAESNDAQQSTETLSGVHASWDIPYSLDELTTRADVILMGVVGQELRTVEQQVLEDTDFAQESAAHVFYEVEVSEVLFGEDALKEASGVGAGDKGGIEVAKYEFPSDKSNREQINNVRSNTSQLTVGEEVILFMRVQTVPGLFEEPTLTIVGSDFGVFDNASAGWTPRTEKGPLADAAFSKSDVTRAIERAQEAPGSGE